MTRLLLAELNPSRIRTTRPVGETCVELDAPAPLDSVPCLVQSVEEAAWRHNRTPHVTPLPSPVNAGLNFFGTPAAGEKSHTVNGAIGWGDDPFARDYPSIVIAPDSRLGSTPSTAYCSQLSRSASWNYNAAVVEFPTAGVAW